MMMLRYRLHILAQRLRAWRAARKATAGITSMLRGHGFVETAPGRWEKPV